MFLGTIFLIILYLLLRYIIAWITYYNNLDSRLGDSTWRFTYDYPVLGERDISDLDDKDFALSFVTDKVKNKDLGPIGIKNEIKKHNIDLKS